VHEPVRVELDLLVRKRDASQWCVRMLTHMACTWLMTDNTAVAIAGPSGHWTDV